MINNIDCEYDHAHDVVREYFRDSMINNVVCEYNRVHNIDYEYFAHSRYYL